MLQSTGMQRKKEFTPTPMSEYLKYKKIVNKNTTLASGFTVIELLVVVVIIAILATIIVASVKEARLKGRNAAIVTTLSSLHAVVDASKYPNSLADLCLDFESGGEFEQIRTGVENNGGIWHCDSTVDEYRIFVKLNQEVVVAHNQGIPFANPTYAQELESNIHSFGNYFCLNSNFESNFTHWSGDNLVYPSCSDADYTPDPEDPVETPEPTPDPDPESDPEPPLEYGGPACDSPKVQVCHFGNTLCISSNALKAHTKHGDVEGICS